MLGGAAVKVVSAYLLIGAPQIALHGAPISTLLCNAAVVLLNLSFAASLCRVPRLGGVFWRPLLAATLAVGGSWAIYAGILLPNGGEGTLATALAILLTVGFYLFFAILTGALSAELIAMLPMGDRICLILQKLRLLDTTAPAQKKGLIK
jgi:stage V sporulation protein B